jgi:hypothetical protein
MRRAAVFVFIQRRHAQLVVRWIVRRLFRLFGLIRFFFELELWRLGFERRHVDALGFFRLERLERWDVHAFGLVRLAIVRMIERSERLQQ